MQIAVPLPAKYTFNLSAYSPLSHSMSLCHTLSHNKIYLGEDKERNAGGYSHQLARRSEMLVCIFPVNISINHKKRYLQELNMITAITTPLPELTALHISKCSVLKVSDTWYH